MLNFSFFISFNCVQVLGVLPGEESQRLVDKTSTCGAHKSGQVAVSGKSPYLEWVTEVEHLVRRITGVKYVVKGTSFSAVSNFALYAASWGTYENSLRKFSMFASGKNAFFMYSRLQPLFDCHKSSKDSS